MLLLDNCRIHTSEFLRTIVEAHGKSIFSRIAMSLTVSEHTTQYLGCMMLFLPPYSPDFNPIEESFSCRMHSKFQCYSFILLVVSTVKAWLRWNGREYQCADDAVLALLEACSTITPEKARGWFDDCGWALD